jgi:cysteine sulfinate desulfinase/cysteine desulfurase-like protein
MRYPGNINLSFAYVEGESLLMGLKAGAYTRPLLSSA